MKVKQLSEHSGVPLSKIKYYIREGLLPSGTLSAPNQATYDSGHLERLELIRVLRDIGGLSIGAVQEVLAALDNPDSTVDPVEAALMSRPGGKHLSDEAEGQPEYQLALSEVREFMHGLDWSISGWGEGYMRIMAEAVCQIRQQLWPDYPIENLEPYARAAWQMSEIVMEMPPGEGQFPLLGDPLTSPTRLAVLATILREPLLLALCNYADTMRAVLLQQGLPFPPVE